jgi:hypothetical protein
VLVTASPSRRRLTRNAALMHEQVHNMTRWEKAGPA